MFHSYQNIKLFVFVKHSVIQTPFSLITDYSSKQKIVVVQCPFILYLNTCLLFQRYQKLSKAEFKTYAIPTELLYSYLV